uniref:Reverse transcriptase domain-containing protein n=1 Tax=Angiostrongylus cantonensis TaxID=6313 RepID=A0A0K0CZX0_ANGCA
MDYIHTIIRPTEVSREYKRPLCLTFIDLQKDFESNEIEAVIEALGSQGVPTQCIKIFRKLYKNFTTKISPFFNDINIDVKRGVRQSNTISPKLFTATLQNVMGTVEANNMGVKIGGRQLHHLRLADDIVLVTPNIRQAERMFAGFDEACEKTDLRLNHTEKMFMRNGLVSCAPFTLNRTNISECSSYAYLVKQKIYHLRFVDDIILITSRFSEVVRMLAKANEEVCLQLHSHKTMFIKNGLISYAPYSLNRLNKYVRMLHLRLPRSKSQQDDLGLKLRRSKRATWRAFRNIENISYFPRCGCQSLFDT